MSLSDYYSAVGRLAQDSANRITPEDTDAALALAVQRYSQDRPRLLVVDLDIVDGGLALPEDWEDGFSRALSLEYPVGQKPPAMLPNEGWYLYQTPDGWRVEFGDGWGGSGQARLAYTVRHALTAAADTLPAHHLEPVASWAAAVLCEQLATYYAGNTDTTIQADTVDHTSPAKQYAARAAALRRRYFDELGIDLKRNVAAGAVAVPVRKNSLGGLRLTHPLRGHRGTP